MSTLCVFRDILGEQEFVLVYYHDTDWKAQSIGQFKQLVKGQKPAESQSRLDTVRVQCMAGGVASISTMQ